MKQLLRFIPWFLTGLVTAAAVLIFLFAEDMTERSALGSFLSGVAAVIAFIWLIAAYYQQGAELRLQRNELSFRGKHLIFGASNFRKWGSMRRSEQIARILEKFQASIASNSQSPVKTVSELPMIAVKSHTGGNSESDNAQEVVDAYNKWQLIEAFASGFLSALLRRSKSTAKQSEELSSLPAIRRRPVSISASKQYGTFHMYETTSDWRTSLLRRCFSTDQGWMR